MGFSSADPRVQTDRRKRKRPAKRAFIIHGYQSFPEEAWLPWLKRELRKKGYRVSLPAMPRPDRPSLRGWIRFIAKLVGQPDRATVMVGHSLGCQAVLRYLETVGNAGKSVGRTVLVAGGFPGGMPLAEAKKRAQGNKALLPWFTVKVDARAVRRGAGRCTVILATDDPYIPVGKAQRDFRENLAARIILKKGGGHFNEDDAITELPAVLRAVTG